MLNSRLNNRLNCLLCFLVGGGLSGLTAAYEILKADANVKLNLLEAKSN